MHAHLIRDLRDDELHAKGHQHKDDHGDHVGHKRIQHFTAHAHVEIQFGEGGLTDIIINAKVCVVVVVVIVEICAFQREAFKNEVALETLKYIWVLGASH